MKDPYAIIKERYVTEKSTVLGSLHTAKSNRSLARCQNPKYVFLVEPTANKCEIARAVEEIYREKNVRVVAVNTLHVKPKATRPRRGRPGKKPGFKKAVVTLAVGDSIE